MSSEYLEQVKQALSPSHDRVCEISYQVQDLNYNVEVESLAGFIIENLEPESLWSSNDKQGYVRALKEKARDAISDHLTKVAR